MESSTNYRCLLARLCKLTNLTELDTTNNADEFLLTRSGFFRILLPIVLVFGVFIIIAIIVMSQRILRQFMQKQRNSRITQGNPPRTECHSREINVISRNYGDLPSYKQVMESIKKGEAPPSYHEVTGSSGFYPGGNGGLPDINSPRQHLTIERPPKNSGSQNLDVLRSINHGSDHSNSRRVITTVGTSYIRHNSLSTEEPLSIVIEDMDDVINSISVSSSLDLEVPENTSTKLQNQPSDTPSLTITTTK